MINWNFYERKQKERFAPGDAFTVVEIKMHITEQG